MNKKIVIVLLITFIFLPYHSFKKDIQAEQEPALANERLILQINNSTMIYNSIEQEIDPGYETAPILLNNRTMVPIRAIIERLGGQVNYHSPSKKITITLNNHVVELWIDKSRATVDSKTFFLDQAPMIVKGRTLVPLRLVIEHLNGYEVEWNDADQTVIISTEDSAKRLSLMHIFYLDAINGNDITGDGSEKKPLKTLEKVWTLLVGGDTVILANGTYSKIVGGYEGKDGKDWTKSPANIFTDWVTFQAKKGHNPHIKSVDLGTWNERPGVSLLFTMRGSY